MKRKIENELVVTVMVRTETSQIRMEPAESQLHISLSYDPLTIQWIDFLCPHNFEYNVAYYLFILLFYLFIIFNLLIFIVLLFIFCFLFYCLFIFYLSIFLFSLLLIFFLYFFLFSFLLLFICLVKKLLVLFFIKNFENWKIKYNNKK